MSGDPVVNEYFRERVDQPFGDVELVSGRTLAPFSGAGLTAADNLLAKADRALTDGDLQRAGHFIDRAAALNYDEHEQTAPAAYAASMMLFNAVTDTLERSREGDSRWLDAAVEALSSTEGWGQSEMRHTLLVVRQDYVIEPSEPHHRGRRGPGARTGRTARCHAVAERSCRGGDIVLQILQTYRAALTATGA